MEWTITDLPSHILVQIFGKVGGPREIARLAGVSRQWKSTSRAHKLWEKVCFEGKDRLNLKQLTGFVNSPYARGVGQLSIEGYVIRRPDAGTQSTITNHVLGTMARKMSRLKSLRIYNANICNLSLNKFPRSLETLSLEGCIVECSFLADLSKRDVLPRLKNLDLNYVHNTSSFCFEGILKKKGLESVQLRHCHKVGNRDLSKLAYLPYLRVLNLSEIANVNDTVLKSLAANKRLAELYLAFTVITDAGILSLCGNNGSTLELLDIRGCPKVTAVSLWNLEEKSRVKEVWVSGKMPGADETRPLLERIRVKDEVELNKFSLRLDLTKFPGHFAEALQEKEETNEQPEVVLANVMPMPEPGYFGRF